MTVLETGTARFQGEPAFRMPADRGADSPMLGDGRESSRQPASVRQAWLREVERTQLAGWFQPFVQGDAQVLTNAHALPRSPSPHLSVAVARTHSGVPAAYRPPLQPVARLQGHQANAGQPGAAFDKYARGLGGKAVIFRTMSDAVSAETPSGLPSAYRSSFQALPRVPAHQVNANQPDAGFAEHAQGIGGKEAISPAAEDSVQVDDEIHANEASTDSQSANGSGALHISRAAAGSEPLNDPAAFSPVQAGAQGLATTVAAIAANAVLTAQMPDAKNHPSLQVLMPPVAPVSAPVEAIDRPPLPMAVTTGLIPLGDGEQIAAAPKWSDAGAFKKLPAQAASPVSLGNIRLLASDTHQIPGPRVHAQWTVAGVELWLGMDGTAAQVGFQAAALMASLQRSLREQGQRLVRVVCNGQVVFDSERQASHSVTLPSSFEDIVAAASIAGTSSPDLYFSIFQKGNV